MANSHNMSVQNKSVADTAELHHIVLPVRSAVADRFDEDLSSVDIKAFWCCGECICDPGTKTVHVASFA